MQRVSRSKALGLLLVGIFRSAGAVPEAWALPGRPGRFLLRTPQGPAGEAGPSGEVLLLVGRQVRDEPTG